MTNLPPPPPGFTLDSAPPPPDGFTLDSNSDSDFRRRGTLQADGTWLVPTPDGPVRLTDAGAPVDSIHTPGGSQDVEATSAEGILNRVLTTAQGGAQGLVPQIAGLRAAALGGDYATARDAARRTVNAAKEEAGVGYEIAGNVLSSGIVAPESIGGRLALSAGVGGVNAAAESGGDLAKTAEGAGLGLVAGGIGEALGYGVRKFGAKLWGSANEAVASRTAKDAAAVEDEIAKLSSSLGGESQKASRALENVQRAASGVDAAGTGIGAVGPSVRAEAIALLESPGARELAEKVATGSMAKFSGQKASIEAIESELATKQASAAADAAQRTRDYFATPLWQSEIAPRLRTLAPRFGLAATGSALGAAYNEITGTEGHEVSGGFVGAVLGAQGVRMMMKNVMSSPRVKTAIAEKMIPLLITASQAIRHGIVPGAALLSSATLSESVLGDTDLAAEQLAARGGLASLVGQHHPDIGHLTGLNAPQTPLDAAIHRTAGVTALAGALDAHRTELDRGLKSFLDGVSPPRTPVRPSAPQADELHSLAASPEMLGDRLSTNLGALPSVAPGVSASVSGVAQRAVQHLSTLASTPPRRGPMAPEWVRSQAENRAIAQAAGIVDNPLVLLHHAATGTLTQGHMNTATAVYPMLTRAIGDRALDLALERKDRPTYRQRQMLSLLTGVDVDGSVSATAANQLAIHAGSVKPSNAGMPGNVAPGKGAEKLSLGQRMTEPHHRAKEAP